MTKRPLKDVPASVRQKLLNIAKDTSRPFGEVLQYFAMERFLYRLCHSPHADSFVLKGALMFHVWDVSDRRATRDIDLLAYLDNSTDNLAEIVREVCARSELDDGLSFDQDSVEAHRIKEDAEYEGVRICFRAHLGTARINMQIDVGFGDLVHPSAVQAEYPALLDLPAPSLRMYPAESVIAEKAQAMVFLGSINSRMKDFYDIWRISQQFNFDGNALCEAIKGTFVNRDTEIVEMDELVPELIDNETLIQHWAAFLQKSALPGPDAFSDVLHLISKFLGPVFSAVKTGKPYDQNWTAPGPWTEEN